MPLKETVETAINRQQDIRTALAGSRRKGCVYEI